MLRTTDLLCRYGGEEFSVLLPAATTDQAIEVLDVVGDPQPSARDHRAAAAHPR